MNAARGLVGEDRLAAAAHASANVGKDRPVSAALVGDDRDVAMGDLGAAEVREVGEDRGVAASEDFFLFGAMSVRERREGER